MVGPEGMECQGCWDRKHPEEAEARRQAIEKARRELNLNL
jgi:hypothetical protein